jgi:ABC-type transport system involved in multi-copper enzyme maturation permease subunit
MITRLVLGLVLSLVQVLAALPWLALFMTGPGKPGLRRSGFWGGLAGVTAGLGVLLAFLPNALPSRESLEHSGRAYAALLQAQLMIDCFVLVYLVLVLVWPKGAAVALAAFREGIRQPMFWLLLILGLLMMVMSPFVPYFTFGEDYLMLKELGFDMVMLFSLLFVVLAASMSISDEIEGRIAITLMSKPVSRRQYLLGKFLGIISAGMVMTGVLGIFFEWVLLYKRWFDNVDAAELPKLPTELADLIQSHVPGAGLDFFRGIGLWLVDAGDVMPGLVLGFCQIMVLLAIAVALATRLPAIVNLSVCLVVYFLGHLNPVLVEVSNRRLETDKSGSAVFKMINFVSNLFYNVLPPLEFFNFNTVLISDIQLPLADLYKYVGFVVLEAVGFTVIALLFGLILFEDRDLA